MRTFIDCEWNEFGGELISLALCPERGPEFYEVLPCVNPGPWVREHVMPVLKKSPISQDRFQYVLGTWLSQFAHVHIIADWPTDIAHFCSALITGPGMRLQTPPLTFEITSIASESECPHNALFDARANRAAYLSAERL